MSTRGSIFDGKKKVGSGKHFPTPRSSEVLKPLSARRWPTSLPAWGAVQLPWPLPTVRGSAAPHPSPALGRGGCLIPRDPADFRPAHHLPVTIRCFELDGKSMAGFQAKGRWKTVSPPPQWASSEVGKTNSQRETASI